LWKLSKASEEPSVKLARASGEDGDQDGDEDSSKEHGKSGIPMIQKQ